MLGVFRLDDVLMEDAVLSLRQVRRRRSVAEKRWIVEQTLVPGASVARVAQAHGVNANVVFQWRRQYQERTLSDAGLIPVVVTEDTPARPAPVRAGAGSIRIDFPGGAVVLVDGSADPALVCTIVKSLRA